MTARDKNYLNISKTKKPPLTSIVTSEKTLNKGNTAFN